MTDDVRIEDGHIGDFRQDPNNARRHTPRNVGLIERSLSETGAGRSLLADRNGVLIAGNATVEAAAAAGIEEAIVVHTRGDKLVIVQRDDLDIDDPVAKKAALYDNRAAELAEWDADVLTEMVDTDLLGPMFTEAELDHLFAGASRRPAGGRPEVEPAADDLSAPLLYRVIVEVADEDAQMALIEELDGRGLRAKALTQ